MGAGHRIPIAQLAVAVKIAAYVRLKWMKKPFTGTSRHAACMLRGLQATDSVTIAATRDSLSSDGTIPADNGLAGFHAQPIPLSGFVLERCWHAFGYPPLDAWCPQSDWIYSPVECYIPGRRAKVAITVHDLHALEPELPWSNTPEHIDFCNRWRAKFRPMVRHTDLFLAVSEFTKTRMCELLAVSPDRIAVVGNGVDDFFFDPPGPVTDREFAIHGNRPYVIVTGGLAHKKGARHALQVAEHLSRLEPAMRVVVVGFNQDSELERSARQLPNVVLAGHVDDELYHALLGRAQCLLFLSRYEGFGIPVLEAMAMGVPVIASRFASIPEVAGDAAILVEVNETEAIAERVRELCRSPSTVSEVVHRGRMRAELSRWNSCVARLRSAFRERM